MNDAVGPSFLRTGISDDDSVTDSAWQSTSIKEGVVVAAYSPSDPGNISKSVWEYDVKAMTSEGYQVATGTLFARCRLQNLFGGVGDRFFWTPRVQVTTTDSTGAQSVVTPGSEVLIECIQGITNYGIIIGAAASKQTGQVVDPDVADGTEGGPAPTLAWQYNGVRIDVAADGSLTLTRKGATTAAGNFVNGPATSTTQASGSVGSSAWVAAGNATAAQGGSQQAAAGAAVSNVTSGAAQAIGAAAYSAAVNAAAIADALEAKALAAIPAPIKLAAAYLIANPTPNPKQILFDQLLTAKQVAIDQANAALAAAKAQAVALAAKAAQAAAVAAYEAGAGAIGAAAAAAGSSPQTTGSFGFGNSSPTGAASVSLGGGGNAFDDLNTVDNDPGANSSIGIDATGAITISTGDGKQILLMDPTTGKITINAQSQINVFTQGGISLTGATGVQLTNGLGSLTMSNSTFDFASAGISLMTILTSLIQTLMAAMVQVTTPATPAPFSPATIAQLTALLVQLQIIAA